MVLEKLKLGKNIVSIIKQLVHGKDTFVELGMHLGGC